MRNLAITFIFELKMLLKKNTTIISTLIIGSIFFSLTFLPSLLNTNNDSSSSQETIFFIEKSGFYFTDSKIDKASIMLIGGSDAVSFNSEETLRDAVENNQVTYGFIINSETSFKMIVKDISMYDTTQQVFSSYLHGIAKFNYLNEHGINLDVVKQAEMIQVSGETVTIGRNSGNSFFFVYLFLVIAYMLILLYGNSVSTSVAREKDSRTMELLITSTKPRDLILGKVFAAGVAGVVQLSVIVGLGVVGYLINVSSYPIEITSMIQAVFSLDVIFIFVLFLIMGYMLYLFIFAALGSLVSKVEDVSGAITPVMFLFVFAYMVATLSINAPNTKIAEVSAYIPFSSLFVLPIRYLMVSVSPFEVIISGLILILTSVLIAYISITIYRQGSLHYGNRMKLFTSLKRALSSNKKSSDR